MCVPAIVAKRVRVSRFPSPHVECGLSFRLPCIVHFCFLIRTVQGGQPADVWTPAPTMVYLGRRLLCESAAHMLSPGLFPRLQAKVCN